MFTEKRPGRRRRRGRPRGATPRGAAAKEKLYGAAVGLLAERGYAATTLRDVADRAGVSPALLYRYFPGKSAVVLALYEGLSATYAERVRRARPGGAWPARFLAALRTSLGVLRPHRKTLVELMPLLVGDPRHGLFAPATRFSRVRVEGAFHHAVQGATDSPGGKDAAALGRVLYVAHLAVILWWLLDRSPRQQATTRLISALAGMLPLASAFLVLERGRKALRTAETLCRTALLDAGPRPAAVRRSHAARDER